MRRIITLISLCLALVAMPMSASAQFDLSKLFGGSKTTTTTTTADPYKKLAESAPAASALEGVWSYDSASFSYVGNNPLAQMAVAQLDPVLADVLRQMGVTKGSAQLQLKGGKGTITHGKQSLGGEYRYTRSTAGVVASTTIDGKKISASGYIKCSAGKLTVMLDVKQMITAIKTVFPEYAKDQNLILVETLLRDIGDVYVVGRFIK